MQHASRRQFLTSVARGMVTAGIGLATARDLGLANAFALQDPEPLSFGALEPLVDLVTATPLDRLMPTLAAQLRKGTPLRELVAAGALANARTFGGEDYVGFHTMMALAPSFHMSELLPAGEAALPVLKVLYRNAARWQEVGGKQHAVLSAVAVADANASAESLHEAVRKVDLAAAERAFASLARTPSPQTLAALLPTVHDTADVHRVVMPHRAYDLANVIGLQHAHTLLRQSVHYCVRNEAQSAPHSQELRALLPKLLDRHGLLARERGSKLVDDGWIATTVDTLLTATPATAAEFAAAALAEGIAPDAVAESIVLTANQLLLRDPGRTAAQAEASKPVGSVHGASTGLHACDTANAWRTMASLVDARTAFANLIVGAWQVANDRAVTGLDFAHFEALPDGTARDAVRAIGTDRVLADLDTAIAHNDQPRATALATRAGELDVPAADVLGLLRRQSITADGALHAEKYCTTAAEEFARTRPAFRWRHLASLARVCASQHGFAAPGVEQARDALKA